jgi:DNA-binding ferritin-like protein
MFEDLINQDEIISELKKDAEEMAEQIAAFKGHSKVMMAERNELTYLLKESSCYFKVFEENLPEEDFEKYTKEARKRYEQWVKDNFEFENPEVKATLKP